MIQETESKGSSNSSDRSLEFDIHILYEDKELLVIDKPSGLVVHPTGRPRKGADGKTPKESGTSYGAGIEPTLVDWLLEKYPEIEMVGESWIKDDGKVIPRPGIVHRLDRETSGVMVVAKTQHSFLHLKQLFKDRKVEKTYNAFVYGKLPETEGTIDRPIGKSNKDFRLWSAQRGARGELREAVTGYTVLKEGDLASFVEVRPKTGRTHQIRVHFKAIHHPVVCDKLYAPRHDCILGLERLALHARRIRFVGLGGNTQEFESPLPDIFLQAEQLL